jgi:hypothetical protein
LCECKKCIPPLAGGLYGQASHLKECENFFGCALHFGVGTFMSGMDKFRHIGLSA